MMKDSFYNYHPTVNLLYFTLVIAFSMLLTHPMAQTVALVCAITYATSVEGKKSVIFLLKFCLPMVLLTAFINPAFNHEGMTILYYFSSGNPLTLESILYGVGAGAMLVTVLWWLSAYFFTPRRSPTFRQSSIRRVSRRKAKSSYSYT